MVTFSGIVLFTLLEELRNSPEFIPLMNRRTKWPHYLLWHGWLPGLTSRSLGSPWAVAASDLACHNLEKALGPYPISTHSTWYPFWDQDDAHNMVDDVPVHPNIWTDGSREPIPYLDVEVAGAGAFVHSPADIFDCDQWGMLRISMVGLKVSSHIFSRIIGPLQSVRRAAYWGVILASQAYSGIHICIDSLNVLRGVAKIIDSGITGTPLPLVKGGRSFSSRPFHVKASSENGRVKVSKVKGHATQATVGNGDARHEDLIGNSWC